MGICEAADPKDKGPPPGDSLGGIKDRLRAGQSGVHTTAQARDYSLLKNVHTDPGVHPASYSARTGVPSPEAKGRAWNLPPSN